MTNQFYIEQINDLLQKCSDTDLLDFILKLLLAQGGNQLLDHEIAVGG